MLDKKQQLQDEEYIFPYHYVPQWNDHIGFRQHFYWSWGFRYAGGLKLVLNQVDQLDWDSLIDVGCGDGRFVSELVGNEPNKVVKGVDYSARAINLAKALNPNSEFECIDIIKQQLNEQYDIATCIETLEHIPLDLVEDFVRAIGGLVKNKGYLVLTVPHNNVGVQPKHFQHFDSKKLAELFTPYFSIERFIPFDENSKSMKRWLNLLGGKGYKYLITNHRVLKYFFNKYLNKHLYCKDESNCLRIAMIAKRK